MVSMKTLIYMLLPSLLLLLTVAFVHLNDAATTTVGGGGIEEEDEGEIEGQQWPVPFAATGIAQEQPEQQHQQASTSRTNSKEDKISGQHLGDLAESLMPSGPAENRMGKMKSFSRSNTMSRSSKPLRRSSTGLGEQRQQQEFVEQVMETYGQPETISRLVKADKQGELYSMDESMQAVLNYVQASWDANDVQKEKEIKKEMSKVPADGCFLSFSVISKEVNPQAWLFDVGTQVSQESLEDLEMFEERETGRKMMRKTLKPEEKRQKKGHLLGHKVGHALRSKRAVEGEGQQVGTEVAGDEHQTSNESNGDDDDDDEKEEKEEKQEEEEEEDEEEEDEEAPIKLSTYAILMAIQKGRKGLGSEATLDWSELPENADIKDPALREAVDKFFNAMIEAASPHQKKEGVQEAKFTDHDSEDHHIAQFLGSVIENGGKMSKLPDTEKAAHKEVFEKQVHGLMQKMVNSVRAAPAAERKEILALAEEKLQELRTNPTVNQEAREKLAEQKQHPYDFMKGVRFAISGRPSDKAFKKMSQEHFQVLVELSKIEDKEHLAATVKELSPEHRAIADTILHAHKWTIRKTADLFIGAGKWVGEAVGNVFVQMAKAVKLVKSKEQTSAEKRHQAEKTRKNNQIVDQKRREKLHWAVDQIRKNAQCHLVLGKHIAQAVYPNKKPVDEVRSDLYARLGAQVLNAVLNTKRFPEGHGFAVAMSVGGSGVIGLALDVIFVPMVVLGLTVAAGPIGGWLGVVIVIFIKFVLKPSAESGVPIVAETFDSAVIKDYMNSLKGQKFWRGMKHFMKTLKEAIPSGMIAAVGSIALNFSLLSSNPLLLPFQFMFNVLSTVTSAAMVPLELQKTMEATVKAIYKKQTEGFFPSADTNFKKSLATEAQAQMEKDSNKFWVKMFAGKKKQWPKRPEQQQNAAYIAWLEREAWRNMEVEQSSRLVINSMGVGPIVSSVVFTLMQAAQRFLPGIPEAAINAVSVMFNSPTEMISMTGAILGANNLGWEKYPHLLSNDEQKNNQIMGLIFQRALEQLKSAEQRLVKIGADELHRIYNPKLGTMGMGRFFVRKGIWLKQKWDQISSRKEYRMKQIGGGKNSKSKLLVANFAPNMVYLITFPRTSAVQNLSPKGLALELWLRMLKIKFYRISDGLFMRKMSDEAEIPYLEFNGKQIRGTLEEIQRELFREMKTVHMPLPNEIDTGMHSAQKKAIQGLQNLLHTLRHRPTGTDFLINDQGLVTELISTLSQLYPKLVDYEVDFVDSWDTLPWQLKRSFQQIFNEVEGEKTTTEVSSTNEINSNSLKELFEDIEDALGEHHKSLTRFGQKRKSSNSIFLKMGRTTLMDVTLFGLLAQFMEPEERQYQQSPADEQLVYKQFRDTSKLAQFYGDIVRSIMGGHAQWSALKKQPWALNYDFKHTPDTDKYNGQFNFDFGTSSPVDHVALMAFGKIEDVIEQQPEADIEAMKKEMREEKVDHLLFGSLWKSQRQWTPEQFERELHARLEQKRRELYRADVGQKVLRHYPPTMAVVADRLLDVVWNWAQLAMEKASEATTKELVVSESKSGGTVKSSEMAVDDDVTSELERAERDLGGTISEMISDYMVNQCDAEAAHKAKQAVQTAFRDQDKAGELFEQQAKAVMLRKVEHFYAGQLRELVVALFNNEKEKKDNMEKVYQMGAEVTAKGLEERVHFVYNLEVGAMLQHAVERLRGKPPVHNQQQQTGGDYEIEEVEDEQTSLLSRPGGIVEAVRHDVDNVFDNKDLPECVKEVLAWQTDALDHIEQSCYHQQIRKDKRRQALVDRLQRVHERYTNLDKEIAAECKRQADWTVEELKRPELSDGERKEVESRMEASKEAIKKIGKMRKSQAWLEVVANSKTAFQKALEPLDKERAERIKQVQRVYELNAKMRQLIEDKIKRESVYKMLSPNRVDYLRQYVRHQIKMLADAESNPELYNKTKLAPIETALTEIEGLQARVLGNMHKMHQEVGKQAVLADMESIYNLQKRIVTVVEHRINPAIIRAPIKQEMLKKMMEHMEKVGVLKQALADGANLPIKHLVLDALKAIKPQLNELVQREKNFWGHVQFWDSASATMRKDELAQKQKALDILAGKLKADKKLTALAASLQEINKIVHQIHGTGADQFMKALNQELDKKGKTMSSVQKRLKQLYEAKFKEHQSELMAKAKYPMAKALLHLSAVYLCQDKNEGKDCAEKHLKLAGTELQRFSSEKSDTTNLLTGVKHVVYHAIADFNENYLIREEILKKYGLPLKAALDKAENDNNDHHWDADEFAAALKEEDKGKGDGDEFA